MNQAPTRFSPDFGVPPGETLQEALSNAHMSQADLARRTGRPIKTINEIVRGKAAITPETAIQLERVLNIPASLWNRLEADYRGSIARRDEDERLSVSVAWLDRFPVKAMVRLGLINRGSNRSATLAALLSFFGVSSPSGLMSVFPRGQNAMFRQSTAYSVSDAAVAVWLRWAEREAVAISTKPFNAARFREVLSRVRTMTRLQRAQFEPEVKRLCAEAGVAVVILPDIPGTRISGATKWLAPDRALIALTIRGKRDDRFWFTFFHEAAHLLLHGRREEFIEDPDAAKIDPAKETEADRWAADALISPLDFRALLAADYGNVGAIQDFAARLDIAPGIVVGRLQHEEKLDWTTPLNRLKRSV